MLKILSVPKCAIIGYQSYRRGIGVHFRSDSRHSCLEHFDLHVAV